MREIHFSARRANWDTDPAEEVRICLVGQDNSGGSHPFSGTLKIVITKNRGQYAGDQPQQMVNQQAQISPNDFSNDCGANQYRYLLDSPPYDGAGFWFAKIAVTFTATGQTLSTEGWL